MWCAASEHDRYGAGHRLKRRRHFRRAGEDDIRLQSDQFPGVGAHTPGVVAGKMDWAFGEAGSARKPNAAALGYRVVGARPFANSQQRAIPLAS
jgi:hypothetical protein